MVSNFRFISLYSILCGVLIFFSSCKKQPSSNGNPEEENELITTVVMMLADTVTQDTAFYTWSQPGGPGTGINVDTLSLKSSHFYSGTLAVWDYSKNPVVNLSNEILERANEHRFLYTSSNSRLNLTIIDLDNQNPPMELGMKFNLNVSAMGDSTGTLRVVLRHYTNASPKTAGPEAGSTDMDIRFPLAIF